MARDKSFRERGSVLVIEVAVGRLNSGLRMNIVKARKRATDIRQPSGRFLIEDE